MLRCRQLLQIIAEAGDTYESSVYETIEKTLTELILDFRKAGRDIASWLDATFAEIAARADEKHRAAVGFDLSNVDWEVGGIEPGELVIVSSETSGGKSALALQAAGATARQQPEDEHETIEFNLADIRQGAKNRLRGDFKGDDMIFWADTVTYHRKMNEYLG